MAGTIFSKQFQAIQGLSGAGPTIVVPDGHVYSIKQLTFYTNPTLANVTGFFRDLGSGAALFSDQGIVGQGTWASFFGTLVFEPGMSFRWEVDTALTDKADVSVHGFDFVTT